MGAALTLATASDFVQMQMKIATVVWIGYGPFYVADALDLYKKQKLKVLLQVFRYPAPIPAAFASDAVGSGMLTYDMNLPSTDCAPPSGVLSSAEGVDATKGRLFADKVARRTTEAITTSFTRPAA